MRYAILEVGGGIHNVVELPDDFPPYIPPVGMSMREATVQDEAVAAAVVPGYAPPGDHQQAPEG